ncbi:MAG: ribonuclease P protein component [Deltaproteobacteria bacterium]|nr:ribonuclease P protein component [Deltaproteobacteria bacterium]
MVEERGETFPKDIRLTKRREYLDVMRHGRKFVTHRLVFFCEDSENGPARLGVTVSRRVGNAVVRNRVKRQIREMFRRRRWELLPGVRIVVVARRSAAAGNNVSLEQDFGRLERWLERRKGRAGL